LFAAKLQNNCVFKPFSSKKTPQNRKNIIFFQKSLEVSKKRLTFAPAFKQMHDLLQ